LSRAELNARNLSNVLDSLHGYLHAGGPLSIETRHGEAAHENEIVFRVADWDAFVLALEPSAGHPAPASPLDETAEQAAPPAQFGPSI
jgi:hypothetical protein